MPRPVYARAPAVCVTALLIAAGTGATGELPGTRAWVPDAARHALLPASREARITINRRPYIVSVSLQRLLLATVESGFAPDDSPSIQANVTVYVTDGAQIDPISAPRFTIRAPWRSIGVALSEDAQAAVVPSTSRSWTGLVPRTLHDDTPNVQVSFRAKGRAYTLNFNDVPINPIGGPGL